MLRRYTHLSATTLAEYLLKSAVDERHQGEVSCDDILEAAEGLGVNIKKETWC